MIGFDDLPIASQLTPSLPPSVRINDLGKVRFTLDGLVHNVTLVIAASCKFIQRKAPPCKN